MMRHGELTVRAVGSDDELRLANDLMAKVHFADYYTALHWLETAGMGYPGFRREHTRIALRDGDVAGALRITTETVRLGEARLKMGGFSWVTTSPRYRQTGVCRALMDDSMDYMRKNNYHVSMLFGIPNFYHRFGFATMLPEYAVVLDTVEALSSLRSALRAREAKPGDISAIQRIHAGNDGDVACSLLRSSAHITNRWDKAKSIRVLTNDQGKVLAYVRAYRSDDHLVVDEVGVSDGTYCGDVLAVCAQLAVDEAVGKLRFLVPPPHLFAHYLLHFKSAHEMRLTPDSGGMMSFVNIGETLESLIPEWESLLAKSWLRDARVEATLLVEGAFYRVRATHGAIDIAQNAGKNKLTVSGSELVQMTTGYAHTEDIIGAKRRMLTDEAKEFLGVIFPKRCPYVWTFDRF